MNKRNLVLILLGAVGLISVFCYILYSYGGNNSNSNYSTANLTDDYKTFSSSKINLSFDYPKYWGNFSEQLRTTRSSKGLSYMLNFADNPNLISGGRSNGFDEVQGNPALDFMGFSGINYENICNSYKADTCEKVNDNIILLARIPTYSEVCPPNTSEYDPEILLLLNLQSNSQVPGLALDYKLDHVNRGDCDNENLFTQRMDTLLNQIKNGENESYNIFKELVVTLNFLNDDDTNSSTMVDSVIEKGSTKNSYKNEQLNFSLEFPLEWAYSTYDDNQNQNFNAKFNKGDDILGVDINVFEGDFNSITDEIKSNYSLSEIETLIKEEDVFLNGYSAKKYTVSTVPLDQDGLPRTLEKINTIDFIVNYDNGFVIRLKGDYGIPTINSNAENLILEVVNSFKSL